jgi:hypothetical protein
LFNSREIATGIWLALFAVWALSRAEIRVSLLRLIQAACHWKILTCIGLMAAYTGVVVAVLAAVGLWDTSLLKDTVYWFSFSGIVLVMESATSSEKQNVFAQMLWDSLKVSLFVEFLINFYTFPVIIELVLVPLVTVIAVMDVFARTKAEYAQVAKLTGFLIGVIGLAILGFAGFQAIYDAETLRSAATFRAFALTPILSIAFVPFIYAMLVVSAYDEIFTLMRCGTRKPDDVVRYGRGQVVRHCGVRLGRLLAFRREKARRLIGASSLSDIDSILAESTN